MIAGLIDALTVASTDDRVRVILLDGAGDHFCGGADIVARNRRTPTAPKPRDRAASSAGCPTQAHQLDPAAARGAGARGVQGARVRGRHRLLARARGRLHDRGRRRDVLGAVHASAGSRPTAARPGCCRAASARCGRASCCCSAASSRAPKPRRGARSTRRVPAAELDARGRRAGRRSSRRARRSRSGSRSGCCTPGATRRSNSTCATRRSRSSCRRAPTTSARA